MQCSLRSVIPAILFALSASASAFNSAVLSKMDAEINRSIARGRLPGGVLWLQHGDLVYKKAYGRRSLVPKRSLMQADTVFDAASLTKVVATAPSVMKLVEDGRLDLDDKVQRWIPELTGDSNKPNVTVRHLLTHTSGLAPVVRRGYDWTGYGNGIALACGESSWGKAGLDYRYSDVNFILLAEIIRRVSGQRSDDFAREHIFKPLKMVDTDFAPAESLRERIAPTERLPDGSLLHGTVHDPTARSMLGVAGHAGMFTTAADLARFAQMLLNDGELDGVRVLSKETAVAMRSVQTPSYLRARRGFGWDIDSPYAGPRGENFPVGSFGHTGWTGTSIWIDPFSKTFVIFLSNRNHPTEAGKVVSLRHKLGTLATEAVRGFNFRSVSGALPKKPRLTAAPARERGQVLTGIDVLAADGFAALDGMKIGLITNHTGLSRDGKTTIDLLHRAKNVDLVKLFSPEHGIRGTADEKIGDDVDRKTGLTIHSLYGETRKPAPELLEDIDALVFDIQDIGCRFYTYISTMGNCMEVARDSGKKFFVLDRPNPIGGVKVEGPVLEGKRSFVGYHDIPVRHGMTVGELAELFRAELFLELELTVIKVKNWRRDQLYDATGLEWVNPSPNIRNLREALMYPGIGLLEFTNLSVGRGTVMPFELVGAPYIDPDRFAAELEKLELPGIEFIAAQFTPEVSKFANEKCGGVRILLKDRSADTVDIGIALGVTLRALYPDQWQVKELNKLLSHPSTRDAILNKTAPTKIHSIWTDGLKKFTERRATVLLY